MDYNSNREKLPLPEYGRNIQNMVNYILTLNDRKERNRAAQSIIDIMGTMYPYLRDIQDFKHKLWDHLAIMANFKLDIDYPYNPPTPEAFKTHPAKIPYNTNQIKYRHYGKILEMMIEKAENYEPGEERDYLIKLIANHMKKSYLTWNKDFVEDSKVVHDLEEMSDGTIRLTNYQLADIKPDVLKPKKKKSKHRR